MTLADKETNLILTDKVNRVIQGNVAMQLIQPADNQWKWRHLVAKFAINKSGPSVQMTPPDGQIWN